MCGVLDDSDSEIEDLEACITSSNLESVASMTEFTTSRESTVYNQCGQLGHAVPEAQKANQNETATEMKVSPNPENVEGNHRIRSVQQ